MLFFSTWIFLIVLFFATFFCFAAARPPMTDCFASLNLRLRSLSLLHGVAWSRLVNWRLISLSLGRWYETARNLFDQNHSIVGSLIA